LLAHALVVAAALAGAVFAAIGIVVRQRATLDVPRDQGVSTVMVSTLLRRRLWWIGTAAAVVGYGFQALALAYGSLLLVAPLLVSALLFALPMSARLSHRRVSRAEWGWASVLTLSLGVFVALARTQTGGYQDAPFLAVVVVGISTVFVTGCVLLALRVSDWRRAILLAVAVGVLFGVVAVLTKIVMHIVREDSLLQLLASPVLYLLIVVGIIATLLQQSAFHAGSLRTSVPAMLVLEPVVAVLLGEIVLGEHLDVSTPAAVALAFAAAAMVAATVALGRDEGAYEEELGTAMQADRLTP
jgi:drug/metabolite transporter (DMT)-like permease